jgi:hypothetical protein
MSFQLKKQFLPTYLLGNAINAILKYEGASNLTIKHNGDEIIEFYLKIKKFNGYAPLHSLSGDRIEIYNYLKQLRDNGFLYTNDELSLYFILKNNEVGDVDKLAGFTKPQETKYYVSACHGFIYDYNEVNGLLKKYIDVPEINLINIK